MKLRLLDAIVLWEPHRRICGVKAVSFEEYMLRTPLGYAERLPESLLLGAVVDLAAWLMILSSDFTQIALPIAIDASRFPAAVGPGQRVVLDLQAHADGPDGMVVSAQGCVGDRVVLEVAAMHLGLYPLTDYHDPNDLRVLFSEIHRSVAGVLR